MIRFAKVKTVLAGATRAQINTTDQTAIFRTGAEAEREETLGSLPNKQSLSLHRAAKPLLAVLAVIIVAGIGFGICKFAGGKQSSPSPSFESMKITKLTVMTIGTHYDSLIL